MKKTVTVLFITLILIELTILIVGLLFVTIPDGKIINSFNSTENGFELINKDNYYAFVNNLRPDEMAEHYDRIKVSNLSHIFFNDLNPYIMYSYLPDIVDGIQIKCHVANKNFFNLYKFQIYKGRLFDSKDFADSENNSLIPIVVGYNLMEKYQIGNTYTFYHGDDGKSIEGQIIGVLKKGSEYSSLKNNTVSLDNSYIIPMSDWFADNYFGLSDYDLAISSAIVEADINIINNVIEETNNSGFWELEALSIKEALNGFKTMRISKLTQRFSTSLIVEAITTVLIVVEIICFIKIKRKFHKKLD